MYLLIMINVPIHSLNCGIFLFNNLHTRKINFCKTTYQNWLFKKNIVTYKKIQINSLVNFILVSAGAPHSGQLVGKLSTSSCKFCDRSESSCCSLEALAALAQSAKNEKKF